MNTLSKSIYKMVPMVMIMGTIFFLSHQRGDEITLPSFANSDLVAHAIAYGALSWTVLFAWDERRKKMYPLRVVFYTVIFCFFYGISDEFHQSFIPGRYVSGLDVLADTIGAGIVCAVWLYANKRSKKSFINRVLP